MYVYTGDHRDKALKERNMIIFFSAINNYYSHTDWYIHTIVQISKLANWQKKVQLDC